MRDIGLIIDSRLVFHGNDVDLINALGVTWIVLKLVIHSEVGMRVENRTARHSLVVCVAWPLRKIEAQAHENESPKQIERRVNNNSLALSHFAVTVVVCPDFRFDLNHRPLNEHGR